MKKTLERLEYIFGRMAENCEKLDSESADFKNMRNEIAQALAVENSKPLAGEFVQPVADVQLSASLKNELVGLFVDEVKRLVVAPAAPAPAPAAAAAAAAAEAPAPAAPAPAAEAPAAV